MIALWILGILLVLFGVYLLLVRAKKAHPAMEALKDYAYAHRGLHDDTRPENSMAAFRAAYKAGYGIELDVHLMKDGKLAVIHDSSLKRTAGVDVNIEDLTAEELDAYYLADTFETIPTLDQVLELYKGEYALIIELKTAGGNHEALCQAACRLLDQYDGLFCMESFDPRCVHWLKKNRPDILRGQLTENFFRSKTSTLPWILKFIMTHQLLNFLTVPDFVAYKFADRKTLGNFLVQKVWGTQSVTWTLRNPEDHETARKENRIPIFENYLP